MKNNERPKWLDFLIKNKYFFFMLACMIAAAVYTLRGGRIEVEDILHFTPEDKILAALVILLLYALKGISAAIFYNVLVIASGLIFSLPVAFLLNLAGTLLCVMLPYWIGRSSKDGLPEKLLQKNPKLRSWYDSQKGYTFLFSLFLRALGLPNEVLGLFFGSLDAKAGSYLLSSLIGIFPCMIFFTVLGRNLDNPVTPATVILGAASLLLAGVTILFYLYKRKKTGAASAEKTILYPVETASDKK